MFTTSNQFTSVIKVQVSVMYVCVLLLTSVSYMVVWWFFCYFSVNFGLWNLLKQGFNENKEHRTKRDSLKQSLKYAVSFLVSIFKLCFDESLLRSVLFVFIKTEKSKQNIEAEVSYLTVYNSFNFTMVINKTLKVGVQYTFTGTWGNYSCNCMYGSYIFSCINSYSIQIRHLKL